MFNVYFYLFMYLTIFPDETGSRVAENIGFVNYIGAHFIRMNHI